MDALLLRGGVKWLRDLELCLADVGWGEVRRDNVKEMSSAEVKSMLNDCAWREVNKLWAEELKDQPKLCVLKELVGRGFKVRCMGVRRKKMRRVLTKLRGGTAELQVEMGRWKAVNLKCFDLHRD